MTETRFKYLPVIRALTLLLVGQKEKGIWPVKNLAPAISNGSFEDLWVWRLV